MPPPVAVGLRLNPGELVASSHSIDTNTYAPFSWVYEKDDMIRNKVAPGQTDTCQHVGREQWEYPDGKVGQQIRDSL